MTGQAVLGADAVVVAQPVHPNDEAGPSAPER
jgi:hypothetical protein